MFAWEQIQVLSVKSDQRYVLFIIGALFYYCINLNIIFHESLDKTFFLCQWIIKPLTVYHFKHQKWKEACA